MVRLGGPESEISKAATTFEAEHGIPWKGLGEYSRPELRSLGWSEDDINKEEEWVKAHPQTVQIINKIRRGEEISFREGAKFLILWVLGPPPVPKGKA